MDSDLARSMTLILVQEYGGGGGWVGGREGFILRRLAVQWRGPYRGGQYLATRPGGERGNQIVGVGETPNQLLGEGGGANEWGRSKNVRKRPTYTNIAGAGRSKVRD